MTGGTMAGGTMTGALAGTFPEPVLSMHDWPMWASIQRRAMELQLCSQCGHMRYPPAPVCPTCLSPEASWTALSGDGHILSWAVFHRQYLPAYPAPYNVVAVKLSEGPIMMTNLEGPMPSGNWIGRRVRLTYVADGAGTILPRCRLDDDGVV